MRLVTYEYGGTIGVGRQIEDGIVPLGYADMNDLIREWGLGAPVFEGAASGEILKAEQCRILSPVQQPGKVLCAGINYASHKEENPNTVFPKTPSFFSKLPSSVIGPEDEIVLPYPECQADYEVELGLVVGRTMRGVTEEDALDYIFGFTILHDVSARDLQFRLQHETIGKSVDTFCPIGPAIVLRDELPDPSSLRIASRVNGETRQSSTTADMLFGVPKLLAFLSSYVTLNPGDVISTGTPAGVGLFRKPPVFLKPGDIIEVEIEGIGSLRNRVVAGW